MKKIPQVKKKGRKREMKYSSLKKITKRTLYICFIMMLILGIPSAIIAQNSENIFGNPPPSTISSSTTTFEYVSPPENELTLTAESKIISNTEFSSSIVETSNAGGSGGNKLGNAPEALFRVLEKFLAKGKAIPPHFPIPYVVYTLSDGGVEKFTDVLTKMPLKIDVDNNHDTGQGGKDISVKTTIEVNPLRITFTVERLGNSNPSYLKVLTTFPAFFYTGETDDPDGVPYWQFGYETQPSNEIPSDITMTFSVDSSTGSDHVFDFDWSSTSGIPQLGFTFGTFQVLEGNVEIPINPAFANFLVSSPPSAFLTFATTETDTLTRKCMTWSAPSSFFLQFNYGETEEISGTSIEYEMAVTVDEVPQSFTVCTEEDRAAGTYSVDYTASSTVDLLEIVTEILIESIATVTIDLEIQDMPEEIHVDFSDGSMAFDVTQNVGRLELLVTADLGLAGISSLINVKLILVDIPDFTATWDFVGFSLDAPSSIGQIEFAFSDGLLIYPPEHSSMPDSNYLFVYSVLDTTALAFRLYQVNHISFEQDNSDGSNELELRVSDRRVTYIIAHTEATSLLTPNHNTDLGVVINTIPTEMIISWTVPFTLYIQTNDAISSIIAELSLEEPGDTLDLSAHIEILDIPANMAWDINPEGSITFGAAASIGTIEFTATDPNGLMDAETFFDGQPIRLLSLTMHDIPSFLAEWTAEAGTPQTSIAINTMDTGAGFGDLTFAISTSETSFVTLTEAGIENRAIFYNDDTLDLGNGLIMEASIWVHIEDASSMEMELTASSPTIHVSFKATQSNELKVAVTFDGTSTLNPASPDALTGTVETTALPTSMEFTITPTSFVYTASAKIDQVTLDLTIGESPSIDIDEIHVEIEGIPTSVVVEWTTDSFTTILNDRLDRVLVTIDNMNGIFGTILKHLEIEILDIPDNVSAAWDINNKEATLSFLGGTYDEGLGDFRFLATNGTEIDTTNYINSLGVALPSMTDYGTFTSDIDGDYWPGTVPPTFNSLYQRHPTLDTGADDYFVSRTGGGFEMYAGRVREIGIINGDLDDPGYADLEFSRNINLARQLYLMMDDLNSDEMTLAEVSRLPDGLPTNSLHAEWNSPNNHYGYTLSETIQYIDLYYGQHDSTSQTSDYIKLLLQDVPASVSIDYDFESRDGYLDFIASSVWQVGILNQASNTRYVGWLRLQSVHFDYSFALPGEEPADPGSNDIYWGYRIFRLDTTLDSIGVDADGVFGIYNLESGLESLDSGTPPRTSEYIPQWTFILDNFDSLEVHILWDVGVGIDLGGFDFDLDLPPSLSIDPPSIDIDLLPSVSISADLSLMMDLWWNDQVTWSSGMIGPIPIWPVFFNLGASLTINEVKDYVNQNPIHLWPLTTLAAVDFDWDWDWDWSVRWEGPVPVGFDADITVDLTIDIPGFHRMPDHRTPFT